MGVGSSKVQLLRPGTGKHKHTDESFRNIIPGYGLGGFGISGGLGEVFAMDWVVSFVVFGAAEFGVLGLFEAAFTVDRGVDLVIRKNEAIFSRFVG
jgi:hypothetical protein